MESFDIRFVYCSNSLSNYYRIELLYSGYGYFYWLFVLLKFLALLYKLEAVTGRSKITASGWFHETQDLYLESYVN